MTVQNYVKIFDKDVKIRNVSCESNNCARHLILPQRLNLYILVNTTCNAKCNFCEYNKGNQLNFDFKKLEEIITEIYNNILIGKINITGGEPTLDLNRLEKVFYCIDKNINKTYKPEIVLNTNGFNLEKILDYENFLSSISLSRHHYDDEKNYEIFKTNTIPSKKDIFSFSEKLLNPNIFFLRCNVIKNYIDNFEELKKYLDHAIDLNCKFCGFASLINLNEYCKNNQIDFNNLISIQNDSFIKVKTHKRFDISNNPVCECANYIYQNDAGKMCKFFSRLFCLSNLNEGQLVYDGKYLYNGFGGEIIY